MSAITFTVNFTGVPDQEDQLAARHKVALENAAIAVQNAATTAENARRAALDPPEAPLPLKPLLPSGTNAELKSSYLSILGGTVTTAHASWAQLAKTSMGLAERIGENNMTLFREKIAGRLNTGETVESILADL
jgi:hypothetical protein